MDKVTMYELTMKRIARLSGVLALLLALSACGGSSSSEQDDVTEEEPDPVSIQMVAGTEYRLYSGDELDPRDDSTFVEVRHVERTDNRFVTLVEGSAMLHRGEGNPES